MAEHQERNIDTEGGNYNERIYGDYYDNRTLNYHDKPFTPVKHIPHTGAAHFVGRSDELITIHEKLHSENTVAISAVSGMGGVGKTELAIKYAQRHENDYPGGICWFNARESNIAASILTFANNYLKLKVPSKDFLSQPLTLKQQVDWCWENWRPPKGLVLLVFDDVTTLDNFSEYLPTNNRFRVLLTTRLRNLDTNIEEISLDVLSPEEALQLLKNLISESIVNKELEIAKELCEWLGYLPLGIELVGRYMKTEKLNDFKLATMLQQLKDQRLQQEAMNPKQATLSTAERGVKAAFELSWLELDYPTQQLAALLSLFASEIFTKEWIVSTIKYFQKINSYKLMFQRLVRLLPWYKNAPLQISSTKFDIDTALKQLEKRHLVNSVESENIYYYKIHTLVREFLQEKLKTYPEVNELKQAFASNFIEISQSIPYSATLELINSVKNAVPHLKEVAQNLINAVDDENLCWAFEGLARFYQVQGLYILAEPWCQQCVSVLESRLGENHPDYAGSLNNLALLYNFQGKYDEAEPLYKQASSLYKRILEENHPDYATSLNNLANLYYSQGKYDEAEPIYKQALELKKRILGENHPDYATSLSNLANLYYSQGKYDEAEPMYKQASSLYKRILGENHPHYAQSLNNLAALYYSQGKYDEAEPIYKQASSLCKRILGENHPNYALSLNNLALLYYSQGKYDEAEPIYKQALELTKRILGENHPNYALSLNNLALLYNSQGKYDEAEPICKQALELRKRILGENHPNYATSLNNLALLYYSQGKYDEAEPMYKQALKIAQLSLGANHPNTITIRKSLELLQNNL